MILEYSTWTYVAIYFSGVCIAVLMHKVYFWCNPQFIAENKQQLDHKAGLLIQDDDDGIFQNINDQDIKYLIWLSWLAVFIWMLCFFLYLLYHILEQVAKVIRFVTDKIV